MSSLGTSFFPMEYQEAGGDALALIPTSTASAIEPTKTVVVGVSEDELKRQIQIARDTAFAQADQKVRDEAERARKDAQEKVAGALRDFSDQRALYFRSVEGEVVQLALAIARKILQREAELDPALLSALVRIALDRMQCGSTARIRVPAEDVALWRRLGENNHGSSPRWEVEPDAALSPGDCIVETELGKANFGFEAQLRDVEESFARLLAHRPISGEVNAART